MSGYYSDSSGFQGENSSSASYQSSSHYQTSTNAGFQSVANLSAYSNNTGIQNANYYNSNMSNQSINPWAGASNYSNNMGSNVNVGSYTNNGFMGLPPVTAINQYNQIGQSGMQQNSQYLNFNKQQNKNLKKNQNKNFSKQQNKNMRSNRNRNIGSQNRNNQNKNFSKQQNNNMRSNRNRNNGNQNRNNPLKRLGNKAQQSINSNFKTSNLVKNRIKYKHIESEDNNETIPPEYLKCHICKRLTFQSVAEFHAHLNSKKHAAMAQIYYAKCESTLQLLRLDAAIASQKIMDEFQGWEGMGMECSICQCPIPLNMQEHEQTPAHNLVSNYISESCCDRIYKGRVDIEEHKLSIRHLIRIGKKEKREMEIKAEHLKNIEALGLEDKLNDMQKALNTKKANQLLNGDEVEDEVYTVSTLPHYDSQKLFGTKYIVIWKPEYFCRVCDKVIERGLNGVDYHCKSDKHYQNLYTFLEKDTHSQNKFVQKAIEYNKKKEDNVTKKKRIKEEDSSGEENSTTYEESQGCDSRKKNKEENRREDNEEMVTHESDNELLNEIGDDASSNESLGEMDTFWMDFCEEDVDEDVDRKHKHMNESDENEINKKQEKVEKNKIKCIKETSSSNENLEEMTNIKINAGSNLKEVQHVECRNESKVIASPLKMYHKGAKKHANKDNIESIAEDEENEKEINEEKVSVKRKIDQNETCSLDYINKQDETEELRTEEFGEHEGKSKRAKIAYEGNEDRVCISEDEHNKVKEEEMNETDVIDENEINEFEGFKDHEIRGMKDNKFENEIKEINVGSDTEEANGENVVQRKESKAKKNEKESIKTQTKEEAKKKEVNKKKAEEEVDNEDVGNEKEEVDIKGKVDNEEVDIKEEKVDNKEKVDNEEKKIDEEVDKGEEVDEEFDNEDEEEVDNEDEEEEVDNEDEEEEVDNEDEEEEVDNEDEEEVDNEEEEVDNEGEVDEEVNKEEVDKKGVKIKEFKEKSKVKNNELHKNVEEDVRESNKTKKRQNVEGTETSLSTPKRRIKR